MPKKKRNRSDIPKWIRRDPRRQAKREFRDQSRIAGRTYNALSQELAPLGGAYDIAAQGISSDLQAQLGSLAGLLGTQAPAGEQAAAGGLFGSIGGGGLEQLAAARSRNLGWNTSVGRQAAMERAGTINRLRELLPQRTSELRDQRFEQLLGLKEFGLREKESSQRRQSESAFADFLRRYIQGQL
jgi:hypothetical protein